jgi:TonB family protein
LILNNVYHIIIVKPTIKLIIMITKAHFRALGNLKLLMVLPIILVVIVTLSSCGHKKKPAENVTEIAPPPPPPPPAPFEKVEIMPVFTGGEDALSKYIKTNIIYPEEAKTKGIEGIVTVKFVVNTDGSVSDAKVMQGIDASLDAEAVRVVNSLPKFEKPGIQSGVAVRVYYSLPISFTLK